MLSPNDWFGLPSWQRRHVVVVLLLFPISFYLYETYETAVRRDAVQASSHHKINPSNTSETAYPTVNLVVASLLKDDISWTQSIPIPNLNIIRYVSDYLDAEFHPPVAKKGYEALIYHTYLHDFYDDLPDISILIHADETAWHVDDVLNKSMIFALAHLDLDQVLQRQYFNLRVSWKGACPAWINTTFTERPDDEGKPEELYMHEAFSENFATNDVPEILGGPCCSQFAVTRDAVRRHPQSLYRQSMDWLVQTHWADSIAGRVWEHMWPWLFLGKAVDCPVESEAYCKMYHICFDQDAAELVHELVEEKSELENQINIPNVLLNPQRGQHARRRLEDIHSIMQAEIERGLERGGNESLRITL